MEAVVATLLVVVLLVQVDVYRRIRRLERRALGESAPAAALRPPILDHLPTMTPRGRWALVLLVPAALVAVGLAPFAHAPTVAVALLVAWVLWLTGHARATPPTEFRIAALPTVVLVAGLVGWIGAGPLALDPLLAGGWVLAVAAAGPGRPRRNRGALGLGGVLIGHVLATSLHPAVWVAGTSDLGHAILDAGALVAAGAAAGMVAAMRGRLRGKKRGSWHLTARTPDHVLIVGSIVTVMVLAATALQATGGARPPLRDAFDQAPAGVVVAGAIATAVAIVVCGWVIRHHRRADLLVGSGTLGAAVAVGLLPGAQSVRTSAWLVVLAMLVALAVAWVGWARRLPRRARGYTKSAAGACAAVAIAGVLAFAPPTSLASAPVDAQRALCSLAAVVAGLTGAWAYARRAHPPRTWRTRRRWLLAGAGAAALYGAAIGLAIRF